MPDEPNPTPDDYAMMRIGLAAALKAEAKRKTIPPLWPGGPGGYGATFEDLADTALGVFRSVMELMRQQRDTAEKGQDLLSARLERVRNLHSRHRLGHCIGCGMAAAYPCATIALLDGLEHDRLTLLRRLGEISQPGEDAGPSSGCPGNGPDQTPSLVQGAVQSPTPSQLPAATGLGVDGEQQAWPSLATGGPVETTAEHEQAHEEMAEHFKDAATWTEEV